MGEPDLSDDADSLGDAEDDVDNDIELLAEVLGDADEEADAVSLRAPVYEVLKVPEEEYDGVEDIFDEMVFIAVRDLVFVDAAETED